MAATCPECGAGVADDARFCASCGARQPERAVASAREVRKVVTVLFADVTGSTALGERLDPEALRGLMNRYFARIRLIVEAHGGTVEKFIGDAVMAVFGIPQVHEDDALRAVRAAAEIRDALASLNAELEAERGVAIRFRTGVNTGEVVAGDLTGGTTLVTGDTVNTAARLEQSAPPGEILLGRLTWTLVRDAVEAEPVGSVEAKGKAERVEAWRLVAVRAGAEGRARHLDAPLVGRERELDRLATAYRSAVADRACTLFTLLGSAGVGKSRLTAEFLDAVAGEASVLRGRCLSYGEGITYWPVGEIVRAVAAISEADDAGAARHKVRELLGNARESEAITDRLAAGIGLSAGQAPKEEVAWAFRRLLEHVARERPLVVVIEDIHWAEATMLELIEHVADWTRDAAIMLLCPARPELLDAHPGWGGGKLNATTLLLEPLAGDATARLIEALPGGAALPEPVVARVMAAAEGNPLYVEELLGMLVDDGLLVAGDDGTWQATKELHDVHVPPSITLLLAARLERLAPAERRVAEHASVVGRVFEQAAVVELAPQDARPAVPAALLALVRKELVRPERGDVLTTGDAFKFRHVLIRDAAYEALPKADRAELHERVADWLVQVARDRLTEIEEIVGHHLEQAHRYRVELGESGPVVESLAARAAERLTAAGIRASERDDPTASTALLEHAVALMPAGRERDLLRLRLAEELWRGDRVGEGVALLEDVSTQAVERGDAVLEARAMTILVDVRSVIGDPGLGSEAFEAILEDARAVVERSGDDWALGTWWRIASNHAWEQERFLDSHAATRRALALAEAAGDQRSLRDIRLQVMIEELSTTTPLDEALAHIDAMLEDPVFRRDDRADILTRRGLVLALLDREEEAQSAFVRADEIFGDLGMRARAGEVRWHMGWAHRLADEYELEEEAMGLAIELVHPGLRPLLVAFRGLARAKLGLLDAARDDLAASAGDPWYRTVRLRKQLTGRIAVASGDASEALRIADEVEGEVLPWEYFLNHRAEVLVECGVIAALAGDTEAARRRGEIALETATRKGGVAMQRKARALLAGDLSRL